MLNLVLVFVECFIYLADFDLCFDILPIMYNSLVAC